MSERPESVLICCACDRELRAGEGHFLLGSFAVCVKCYDAGHRGPPPAAS